MTNGAFDISAGTEGNTADIKINKRARTVRFTNPSLQIDVEPILEGFLADRLMNMLWDANIDNALVEVGGTSRSVGNDIVGPWRKNIPDMKGKYASRGIAFTFSNAAVATVAAGTRKPGMRYKEPKAVANDLRSATAVAQNAAMAEAIAHAIYNLGADAGMGLAERLPKIQAVVRDSKGSLRRSPGL